MKFRLLVSMFLAGCILAFVKVFSGASAKMFGLYAMFLIVGFVLPCCFIEKPFEIIKKWPLVLLFLVVSIAGFDVFSSILIVKREVLSGWQIIYPMQAVFLMALIFSVTVLSRKRKS